MKIIMELFVCAFEAEEKILYHHFQVDITHRESDPDAVLAQALAENGIDLEQAACYVHSTSWRYDAGSTILTYLAWVPAWVITDVPNEVIIPRMVEYSRTTGIESACSRKPTLQDVLIHGLRYFRFLLFECKDPRVSKAVHAANAIRFFRSLPPELAGRI